MCFLFLVCSGSEWERAVPPLESAPRLTPLSLFLFVLPSYIHLPPLLHSSLLSHTQLKHFEALANANPSSVESSLDFLVRKIKPDAPRKDPPPPPAAVKAGKKKRKAPAASAKPSPKKTK